MNPSEDPFVGAWELDPSTLDYQFGRPGRRALYTIEAAPGGLMFTLDGGDADGRPLKFRYGGELDGREQALPGGEAAGVLILNRLNERTIESVLKRGGKVVDRWTRELLPDGKTMQIIQYGLSPDGGELRNTSLYRRVAPGLRYQHDRRLPKRRLLRSWIN